MSSPGPSALHAFCRLSKLLPVFVSSQQAKTLEDLQSLHFTWLHMKGRLKRRESQRETNSVV